MSVLKRETEAPALDTVEVTTSRLDGFILAEFIEANGEGRRLAAAPAGNLFPARRRK